MALSSLAMSLGRYGATAMVYATAGFMQVWMRCSSWRGDAPAGLALNNSLSPLSCTTPTMCSTCGFQSRVRVTRTPRLLHGSVGGVYLAKASPMRILFFSSPSSWVMLVGLWGLVPCKMPVTSHLVWLRGSPAHVLNLWTLEHCTFMLGTVMVTAVTSSANTVSEMVCRSRRSSVARHFCLYPLPPTCSHLIRGSMNMITRRGGRVSPLLFLCLSGLHCSWHAYCGDWFFAWGRV